MGSRRSDFIVSPHWRPLCRRLRARTILLRTLKGRGAPRHSLSSRRSSHTAPPSREAVLTAIEYDGVEALRCVGYQKSLSLEKRRKNVAYGDGISENCAYALNFGHGTMFGLQSTCLPELSGASARCTGASLASRFPQPLVEDYRRRWLRCQPTTWEARWVYRWYNVCRDVLCK